MPLLKEPSQDPNVGPWTDGVGPQGRWDGSRGALWGVLVILAVFRLRVHFADIVLRREVDMGA